MLVCNVSLRPPRSAIAADLAEAATADDSSTTGQVVFATLVDDPASVAETVDAYLGEIMLEAASAGDTLDAYIPTTYAGVINETMTAADTQNATITTVVPSTWNPSDKSANVTLSNGNLTVGASTGADGGVRSTLSKATGKVYFEYNPTNMSGADTGLGVATGAAPLTGLGPNATGGVIIYSSGSVYYNGTGTAVTIGAFFSSGTVCIAVDIAAGLFWARLNAGNWNGSGTANPATGVGGLSVSTLFPTNALFAAVSVNSTATAITANFGATAFAQTVPSGFTAWNSL